MQQLTTSLQKGHGFSKNVRTAKRLFQSVGHMHSANSRRPKTSYFTGKFGYYEFNVPLSICQHLCMFVYTKQLFFSLLSSYCFRLGLSDGTGTITMTCFSDEANCMVKDCKELLQTMPQQDSYDYPPELLCLQGKKKIFQLHFDPQCTKERPLFILDTCWDDMPLLLPSNIINTENAMESSAANAQETATLDSGKCPITMDTKAAVPMPENKPSKTLDIKQSVINPPMKQPRPITVAPKNRSEGIVAEEPIEVTPPAKTTMAVSPQIKDTTLTPLAKQATQTTTPTNTPPETSTDQEPLSKTSKAIKQTTGKSARRPLFTGSDDDSAASIAKKTKKEE